MSLNNNEEWDLCWNYLSSTGSRNLAARGGIDFARNMLTRISCRGDSQKTTDAQCYWKKQHQDGGVEDEYRSFHYTDMDKRDGCKKSIQFRKNLGYQQESKHTLLFSNPSVSSSSGNTSALNSISTAILMSQLASYSEDDMVKNDVLEFGKFWTRNSRGLWIYMERWRLQKTDKEGMNIY